MTDPLENNQTDDYLEKTVERMGRGELVSFQQWLNELSASQLETLSSQISKEKPKEMEILAVLAMYFANLETGQEEFSEDEINDLAQLIAVSIACMSNVKEGKMTLSGELKITDSSTAKFRLTDKGIQSVKDMADESK